MASEQAAASGPVSKAIKIDESASILKDSQQAKDASEQMMIMMQTLLSVKTSQDDMRASTSVQINEVKTQVDTPRTKVDGVEVKVDNIDDRVKALESRPRSQSQPSSRTQWPTQSNGGTPGSWQPGKIEVKGFMTEEAWKPGNEALKEQQAKSKAECIQAAYKIHNALPAELQQSIDLKRLDKYSAAYLYYRIDIPMVSGAPAKLVLEAIQQALTRLEFLPDGHLLRAYLEKRPENKEVSKLLGKAFGALRELGVKNEAMAPAYNPLLIKSIGSGRPRTAFAYKDGAWKLEGDGKAKLLPEVPEGEVLSALNRA
jgi:hypothetical protein